MHRSPLTSRRARFGAVSLLAAAALVSAFLPGVGAQASGPATAPTAAPRLVDDELNPFLGGDPGLGDSDVRRGAVAPTTAQRSAVQRLGAEASWNRFGTPRSLINHGGYLGGGVAGNAAADARAWLNGHANVFGMTGRWANGLELVSSQSFAQSPARAVLFRQRFGGLTSGFDGLVTVGVANDKIAYVSSSLAQTNANPPAAQLSAVAAWRRAAADVGRNVSAGDVGNVSSQYGWTLFTVDGFAQVQRTRLRALPTPSGAVRPVWESNVVDIAGGTALAFTSFVDAVNGNVLVRHSQVDHSEYSDSFTGSTTDTECGELHPFDVDDQTKSISATASYAIPSNDLVLKLIYNGNTVASQDTGTSPEALTYAPGGGVPEGTYNVQVCPFDDPMAPFVEPGTYVGTFTASEQASPNVPYPPKWKTFLSNPALNFSPTNTTDNRQVGCWVTRVDGQQVPNCDNPPSPLNNLAARAPWDYDFRTNSPTFTTDGNAASTAEAWLSPLTPGGLFQRPVETNREYIETFEDVWNNSQCDPTSLTPGGNDILASVANLFAGHNRFHDFSYFLGFTEANYNGQKVNNGLTQPSRENDPEIGNVQAGAITGGFPSYVGRDNANQITLQDGIPGITNQYLFQPIAGGFYAPCTDGDFDTSVYGHEYTHFISGRMVAGPDSGITGFQGGSMGEAWSDQVALEYQFEHSYDMGAGVSPFVEGPYVTGNKQTGIRNYALDDNPLQYGDLGYDVTGPEVHADGEPWNAAMFDVRQQLVNKYNGQFPVGNEALQRRCSQGATAQQPPAAPLPANRCPGNRRWIQLMFDSFLLQQSATSMLDARDAMLAADVMRFGGANQRQIWHGFASDGMGSNASTASTEDDQPTPGYMSPLEGEGTLRLTANEFDSSGRGPRVSGKLYVGRYEGRVTPIADTDPSTALPNTVRMVPGNYSFVFQADGFGLTRFNDTLAAGQVEDKNVHLATNLASTASGARVDGASPGSVNTTKLIDDTEASNWAGINPAGVTVDTLNPFVNVNLAGNRAVPVRSVKVSALLRPADPGQDEDPDMPDDESGSRFTALRDFAIATCTQSATSDCSSTLPPDTAGSPYSVIYDSTDGRPARGAAFDSTLPRPLAPDLLFQKFDVPDTNATHVRLIALENQCTGTPEFAGEQDNDPLNATDCKTASDRGDSVRAAELEVFSFDSSVRPPQDPVVAATLTGPATAGVGDRVRYTFSYTNLGPRPVSDAVVTDTLPSGLAFVSANAGGVLRNGTVRWDVGGVAVNETGTLGLTTRVARSATLGSVLLNQAQLTAPLTYSLPAAAATTVVP